MSLIKSRQRKRKRSPSPELVLPRPLPENLPQFRHGAIRKLVLHNFLTFDDVVLHPSPQLNVIVGPNGTGKSSLVCAICLGLCGRPNLLGRAKHLKDFVKHGPAKEAFIEITLHHRDGYHPVIRREIKKETSSSKWFINQRDKLEHEVQDFIKIFDIQLENKCQFLPQDKVVEFAKLDQYQLLEETEKAIGKDDMYKLHQELKGLKTDKQKLEDEHKNKSKDLDKLMRENSLLERDVNRLRTREDCLLQIKHLQLKKYWLDYEDARTAYSKAKEKRKDAEKLKKELHKKFQPLIKKLEEKVKIVKNFQEFESKCCREVKDMEKSISLYHSKLAEMNEAQNNATREFNDKVKENNDRAQTISQLQGEIESLKKSLEDLPSPESIKPKMSSINNELHKILKALNTIQEQQLPLLDEKNVLQQQLKVAQDKLKEIQDVHNQRIAKLNEQDHQTVKAIEWLNSNKSLFQHPVHNPVIVLLQIKNMKYAPQVENFFMGKDAFSFICESTQDYNTFGREVRDKLNLKINVVVAPDRSLSYYQPSVPLRNITQYGFKHMLMDLIDAPPAVLAYFCQYHHLHEVPIADSARVERFINACPGVGKFYVANDVYVARRSRYSNKTITRSDHIRACRFFLSSVNEVEKATRESDISECTAKITDIDRTYDNLKREENDLRKADRKARDSKNALRESINARSRSQRTLESRQIQLDGLLANPISLEKEKDSYKNKLKELFTKKTDNLKTIAASLQDYQAKLVKRTKASIDLTEADIRKKHYETEKESVTDQLKQAEIEVDKSKVEEVTTKNSAMEKLSLARRKTGADTPDEFKDIFDGLPSESQDIEENIHQLQTQADLCGMVSHNGENIVEQYEKRKKEIEDIGKKLRDIEDKLANYNQKASLLEEQWLKPLEAMMKDVNDRFSHFFGMMNCVGEVSLAKHSNDYSKYGVNIRVKFRTEEDLQLLTAQRQSGGERSVSTMMYLMALQDNTSCPFRVVDEINQGMDSTNERRVFNLIVDTVKQKDTSQYFMLTPKLLQDLKYSETVTVHSVHNGPELMPYNSWPSSS